VKSLGRVASRPRKNRTWNFKSYLESSSFAIFFYTTTKAGKLEAAFGFANTFNDLRKDLLSTAWRGSAANPPSAMRSAFKN
jgi:hypothetical protein